MQNFFDILFFLGCFMPILLIPIGWALGTLAAHRFDARLDQAEQQLQHMLVTDTRATPAHIQRHTRQLVVGTTVVSTDHFRTLLATLRKIIGGEIGFYTRLLERGRRHARCRMLQQAQQLNAVAVINVRMETSNLQGLESRRAGGAVVEIIAYGTAIIPEPEHV